MLITAISSDELRWHNGLATRLECVHAPLGSRLPRSCYLTFLVTPLACSSSRMGSWSYLDNFFAGLVLRQVQSLADVPWAGFYTIREIGSVRSTTIVISTPRSSTPRLTMEWQPEALGKQDRQVSTTVANLQDENRRLSDQIKRLVRAEHELSSFGQLVDQIRIYRHLYEVGKVVLWIRSSSCRSRPSSSCITWFRALCSAPPTPGRTPSTSESAIGYYDEGGQARVGRPATTFSGRSCLRQSWLTQNE